MHTKTIKNNKIEHEKKASGQFSKIFQFVTYVLRPYKFYLIVISVMAFVQISLTCFRELSLKFIIDSLALADYGTSAFVWLIVLTGNNFIIEMAYRVVDKCNYKYLPLIKQNIIKLILKHMIKHDYSFYQDKNSTELTSCIVNIAECVEDCVLVMFDNFLNFFLLLFITSGYALVVSAKIAMLLLAWGVIWLIVSIYVGSKMYVLTYTYTQSEIELEGNMSDLFSHMFTVYSSNNNEAELKNINTWTEKVVKTENALRAMQFKCWIVQGFVFCIVNGLMLFYTLRLHSQGLVTIGDISMVFGLVINLYANLWTLAKEVREFIDYIGKIGQAIKLINIDELSKDMQAANDLKVGPGKIRFSNLEFAYPRAKNTKSIISQENDEEMQLFAGDVSFTISAGEYVGLVGPSGSGKSSLIKLLLRMFELDGGKILIDNQDISTVSINSLRKHIAVIPQDAGIFMHRTLAENIGYGTFDVIDEEAMEQIVQAAKKTQSHEFIMRLPEQYNTVLSQYGINISGGQKQRIAIARGFVRNASIFLFDEATSALDNITQSKVQKQIRQLVKGKTTIVVAHRLQALKDADRIFVFDKGKLVQEGSPSVLEGKDGLYKTLWLAQ